MSTYLEKVLTRKSLLSTLASMPFLDAAEVAAVANRAPRTTLDALRRMQQSGHVGTVRHSRSSTSSTRRWYLTPAGINWLASMSEQSPDDLIRAYPITERWQQRHLARMEVLASVYRVAHELAATSSEIVAWRWYREGPLEAAFQLTAGRAAGLMRIGTTHSGRAIASRFGTIRNMRRRDELHTVLVLVPGQVEFQRVQSLMNECGLRIFVAFEQDIIDAPIGHQPWRSITDDSPTTLNNLMRIPRVEMPPVVRPRSERIRMPTETLADDADLTSVRMTVPERRMMRLLFDWPVLRASQVRTMMGISEGHARRAAGQLSKIGFVHHLRIGRTPAQRYRNEPRLCLSAVGLRHLARVDRSNPHHLTKHWSIEPNPAGDETFRIENFLVQGSKARTLLKERNHTDSIYAFIALLVEAYSSRHGWTIEQVLPPHRWERRFKHGARRSRRHRAIWRAIRPDATILLRHPEKRIPIFLEMERRAIAPASMAEKIAKYRNYFGSPDTKDDISPESPNVLFVFEKADGASRLAAHASRDGGEPLPLLVSSMQQIEAGGVFGRVWLDPWRLEAGHMALRPAENF